VVADRAGVAQWEPGQVPPDTAIARRMPADAGRHLATAAAADSTGDLPGACQLACDALRKSAASLPGAQGLRATSRGGHIAVQDPVTAQFGPGIRALRSFSRLRRPQQLRVPRHGDPRPFGRRRQGRDRSRPRGKRRGRQDTGKRNPLPLAGDSSAGPGISARSRRYGRTGLRGGSWLRGPDGDPSGRARASSAWRCRACRRLGAPQSPVRTGRAGGTIRRRFRLGFLLSCASGGLR
jgi:hypothetical protein